MSTFGKAPCTIDTGAWLCGGELENCSLPLLCGLRFPDARETRHSRAEISEIHQNSNGYGAMPMDAVAGARCGM